MNKFTNTLFVLTTIMMTGCQAATPLQVNVPVSDVSYAADNTATGFSADIEPLDGKGNNIANPDWGSGNQQFLRHSAADYADGISSPSGADRPSARVISNAFSESPEDGIPNDRDFTAFVYAWGQFLDHDIDLTETGTPKEAFPIVVPKGDPWFDPSSTGTMTIPMSRSKYDPTSGTSIDRPRQQVNSITAFIDGSQIYAVDAKRAAALREFSGGQMKMSSGNLPPLNTDSLPNANDAHILNDNQLFLAGDIRANENPELLSLHALFIREHNRIAAEAAKRHPDWSDDALYQYARRIVIAELQKITYDEFLPAVLGTSPLPAYKGYRADVNPSIATEFSTAAFRVGHSMLGDDIEFLDSDGNDIRDAMLLRDSFFNPSVVNQTGIDPILKYLASDNAQEIDTKVVDDVRNFLFGAPGQGGFDLASLNIQRGRDHGLADYNSVRVSYGLARVTNFDQITADPAMQASLASTYGSVDNIDLWVGGLAEDHLANSSMGATFTAILVDQFTRLRDGDRFWYQASLSQDQIGDIQNTSLADIVRLNTTLTKLQENVFFFNDSTVMIEAASITQGPDPQATPPPQTTGQHSGRRRPPQAAFDACLSTDEDTSCSFTGRNNDAVNGTCQTIPGSQLACVPARGPGGGPGGNH
jgi:peroxidase